ncbi:MAG: SRPBCC domain-containing protein [Methyloceanibacter sp.]
MAARNSVDLETDPRSIIGTRVFDAPRELVFSAWTDPKHLAQWWGPDGFTTTTSAFEFRAGGVWRFVMHGPDGRDYENRITFDEIVPPERIVYHHGGGDDVEPVQFNTTVSFEALGSGKTRLTMRGVFPSAKERDRVIKEYGADKGLVQTLARLGEYVAAMAPKTSPQPPPQRTDKETSMQVHPYLFFDGRCEEAIEFYKKALGAEVATLMRYKDGPEPSMCPPGSENKVMHASFRIGDTSVMASDGRNTGKPVFQGFSLTIAAKSDAEAEKLFAALGDGGQVQMPLTKTFFSSRFGMVADRFGVSWMIIVAASATA